VVFQPHRYTRTQFLLQDFYTAFNDADVLILLDIYAASETPIPGISSQRLYEGIKEHGHRQIYYLPERHQVLPFLRQLTQENDILMTLGAGDVWQISRAFCRVAVQE
jgi:UDP-N-acetylmuramate--alanine ligase